MPSLTSLPNELLLSIIEYLCDEDEEEWEEEEEEESGVGRRR